jgi:hypothetical protein
MWVVFGYILLGMACLHFAFKVFIAFDTKGGEGGVPMLDAVVFPPVFTLVGLSFVGLRCAWWFWAILWIGSTIVAYGLMEAVTRLAKRSR